MDTFFREHFWQNSFFQLKCSHFKKVLSIDWLVREFFFHIIELVCRLIYRTAKSRCANLIPFMINGLLKWVQQFCHPVFGHKFNFMPLMIQILCFTSNLLYLLSNILLLVKLLAFETCVCSKTAYESWNYVEISLFLWFIWKIYEMSRVLNES